MLQKKMKISDEVVGAICDMCNKSCAGWLGRSDFRHEYGTLYADWGFWSKQDLTKEECHLCEDCFGKVRDFIHSQGGKVRKQDPYNMMGGPNYKDEHEKLPGIVVNFGYRDRFLECVEDVKNNIVEENKVYEEDYKQHQKDWESYYNKKEEF